MLFVDEALLASGYQTSLFLFHQEIADVYLMFVLMP
jgi:hypothetical protein